MSKHNNAKVQQAAAVATEQVTVAGATSLRARRMAAVQATLYQRRIADKQARFQAIRAAYVAEQERLAKHQQFQLRVAELAQEYGFNPAMLSAAPRANSATDKPSSSAINVDGVMLTPCKAVQVLAAKHQNRKDTLAACKLAGINPSTAATQWGVWKKANGQPSDK
jgi:hypothetical protein